MSCEVSFAIFGEIKRWFSHVCGRKTKRQALHIIIYACVEVKYHFANLALKNCLVLVGKLPIALDVLIEDARSDANGQHSRTRLYVVCVGEFGIEIFLESNVVAGDGGS